jgi:hypothetical protein
MNRTHYRKTCQFCSRIWQDKDITGRYWCRRRRDTEYFCIVIDGFELVDNEPCPKFRAPRKGYECGTCQVDKFGIVRIS